MKILCIFGRIFSGFEGDQRDHQMKRNFRKFLFIYMSMTSNQKTNNICILMLFDQPYRPMFEEIWGIWLNQFVFLIFHAFAYFLCFCRYLIQNWFMHIVRKYSFKICCNLVTSGIVSKAFEASLLSFTNTDGVWSITCFWHIWWN